MWKARNKSRTSLNFPAEHAAPCFQCALLHLRASSGMIVPAAQNNEKLLQPR